MIAATEPLSSARVTSFSPKVTSLRCCCPIPTDEALFVKPPLSTAFLFFLLSLATFFCCFFCKFSSLRLAKVLRMRSKISEASLEEGGCRSTRKGLSITILKTVCFFRTAVFPVPPFVCCLLGVAPFACCLLGVAFGVPVAVICFCQWEISRPNKTTKWVHQTNEQAQGASFRSKCFTAFSPKFSSGAAHWQ